MPEMLLLRSLPDLATGSAELHESLRSKGGRENCIIWGRARRAEFGPYPHALSIRAAWGGTQYCHLDERTIAVDDDSFLVLNHGQTCSTSIDASQPVESLTICFQPELVRLVHGESEDSIEQAMDRRSAAADHSPEFIENLQPNKGKVGAVLNFIRAHLWRGLVCESWYEEQLVFLLERMRCRQSKLLEQIDQLALIRPATRRETYRRIGLATDFLHTHFAGDVDLKTLAGIAELSKFHFLRLFILIQGVTPHTYLQRKRADAAVRLLQATQLSIGEVAMSVGFANESTLLRHVRRRVQLSPRQIRARMLSSEAA
jgi:AraC-like DNA-binding protein